MQKLAMEGLHGDSQVSRAECEDEQQKERQLDFGEQEEEDANQFKLHILTRKLESFDVILDDINLELSEFLEEMAN